jgi:hypothetical protein
MQSGHPECTMHYGFKQRIDALYSKSASAVNIITQHCTQLKERYPCSPLQSWRSSSAHPACSNCSRAVRFRLSLSPLTTNCGRGTGVCGNSESLRLEKVKRRSSRFCMREQTLTRDASAAVIRAFLALGLLISLNLTNAYCCLTLVLVSKVQKMGDVMRPHPMEALDYI